MAGVNAIMADGNLNADQKKGAIDNIVKYANSQIDWASKFYGTSIPAITTPSQMNLPSGSSFNPQSYRAKNPDVAAAGI